MPLPLEHTLHYRCAFELKPSVAGRRGWVKILEMVRAWTSKRVPKGKMNPAFRGAWFFTHGEWRPSGMPRLSIVTDSFAGSGDGEHPQYWACRFEHPCTEVPSRQWRTDVGITSLDGGGLAFSLSTSHWLPQGYFDEGEGPIPSAPGIVAKLLLPDSGLGAHAGSETLAASPFLVRDGSAELLVEHLASPARSCPIVLIAKDFNTEGHLVDPHALAKVLAGTAAVYMAESSWMDKELEKLLPPAFRCWNGMVRVYQPGLNLEREADARRHRFFRGQDIEGLGQRAVQELLVRGIVRRSSTPKIPAPATIEEVRRKGEEARLRELMLAAQAAKDTAGQMRVLEEENEQLIADLHQKDQEIEDWKAFSDDYDTMSGEVARYKHELEATRARANEAESVRAALAAKVTVLEQLERLPTSIEDVLELIGKVYPDRIAFTEKARRSAREATVVNLNKAWQCLRAMATVLYDLHFRDNLRLREIGIQFKQKTGFELAIGESEGTKKSKKLSRMRKDKYKGVPIDISMHVKYGNSPGNLLRVHYYPHAVEKLLVIGHCGDHLDTQRTN